MVSPPNESLDLLSFPAVEHVLGTEYRIHDTIVTIQDRHERNHEFLICYQYDARLPINRSISEVIADKEWRGGLVVMKRGNRHFVRGLRGGFNTSLAKNAVSW